MKTLAFDKPPNELTYRYKNQQLCAGEKAGLPDVVFVDAEKFSEIYITLIGRKVGHQ